jgi:hypothetical protein
MKLNEGLRCKNASKNSKSASKSLSVVWTGASTTCAMMSTIVFEIASVVIEPAMTDRAEYIRRIWHYNFWWRTYWTCVDEHWTLYGYRA